MRAMLAPSAAARLAIARPIPRLAPEMNMVLPERDMTTTLSSRRNCIRGGTHSHLCVPVASLDGGAELLRDNPGVRRLLAEQLRTAPRLDLGIFVLFGWFGVS